MRWEDERYVKVYTRDTPEWCTLSFGARGLFCLILRVVDRAGVLALGKLGARGVAVAVRGSWTEVEPLLAELVADGCVTIRDDRLIVPNFIEAQETRQSDAARQRASREKARALVGGSTKASKACLAVTKRDPIESQNVTKSHQLSPAVTSCHSESRVDESRQEPPCIPPSGETKKQSRGTRLPADWLPDEVFAARKGWSASRVAEEAEHFRAHHEAKGTVFKNWASAWRTWVLNGVKFDRRGTSSNAQRQQPIKQVGTERPWMPKETG